MKRFLALILVMVFGVANAANAKPPAKIGEAEAQCVIDATVTDTRFVEWVDRTDPNNPKFRQTPGIVVQVKSIEAFDESKGFSGGSQGGFSGFVSPQGGFGGAFSGNFTGMNRGGFSGGQNPSNTISTESQRLYSQQFCVMPSSSTLRLRLCNSESAPNVFKDQRIKALIRIYDECIMMLD